MALNPEVKKQSDIEDNRRGTVLNDLSAASLRSRSMFEESQTIVKVASETFKELAKTLEVEQVKLNQLEERRKNLQAEMQNLRNEIEEQRRSYRLSLIESISDNLQLNIPVSIMEFTDDDKDEAKKLNVGTQENVSYVQDLVNYAKTLEAKESMAFELSEEDNESKGADKAAQNADKDKLPEKVKPLEDQNAQDPKETGHNESKSSEKEVADAKKEAAQDGQEAAAPIENGGQEPIQQ